MFSPTGKGIAIAMVIGVFGSAAAIAENATSAAQSDSPSTKMEEIVVTAQRREQAIGDVPQSVQALTDEYLQDTGVKSLDAVIDLIPSASQVSGISAASTVYQIRAISPSEGIGDATVGYYVDNLAFSMPGLAYAPAIDFFDIERVEVLRGPSGTLYGLGSLGGTVKTITKDPNFEGFETEIKATTALSDDADPSYSGDVMLNVPLIEDKLAVRGVIDYRKRGGYAEILPYAKKNGNPTERTTARLKILAQPIEELSLKLAYWNMHSRQEFIDRVTFFDPPRIDNTAGSGNSDYDFLIGDIEYDLGFGVLQSTTGYTKAKLRDNNDGVIALPVGSFESKIENDIEVWNQDLRLSVEALDGNLNYIVGFFYQDAETVGGQDVLLPTNTQVPGNVGLDSQNDNSTESKSWALYSEGTYTLPNIPVDITVGLRYFKEERTFDQNSSLRLLTFGVFVPTIGVSGYKEDTLNPRFNVAWRPSDNGMLYISASKGFRSGAINSTSLVTAANRGLGSDFSPLNGPDELWNYEIGAKWSLFDGALDVNAAFYLIDWTDAQVAISPVAQFIIVPMGDVEGKGFDLEVVWRTPIDGLTLAASGNLNETELKNVDPRIQASTAPRLSYMKNGNQLVATVKETLATVLNYERPLGYEDWNLNFNLRYSYRGKQQSPYDGRFTGDLDLVYTRLSVGNERYEFELFSDNLTNDKGPISVPGGQHTVPYPRTFGVGVHARF